MRGEISALRHCPHDLLIEQREKITLLLLLLARK
jgi:hypothetical protein